MSNTAEGYESFSMEAVDKATKRHLTLVNADGLDGLQIKADLASIFFRAPMMH